MSYSLDLPEDFRTAFHKAIQIMREAGAVDGERAKMVGQRRQLWRGTSDLIERVFREVASATMEFRDIGPSGPLFVQTAEPLEHLGLVQISFGTKPNGIMKNYENGGGSVGMEEGAALVAGQSESAMIAVFRYPFVNTLPGVRRTAEPAFVGAFEPAEVTEEIVLGWAQDFYTWALDTSYVATVQP